MSLFVKFKTYFKIFLFSLAILLIFLTFLYTNSVVNNLRKDSKNALEPYANFIAQIASSPDDSGTILLFDSIIKRLEFPIVITDEDGEPTMWKKEIGIDPELRDEETLKKVKDIVKRMDKNIDPIPLESKGLKLGYIHYSDSQFIKMLSWLPYVQILAIGLFVLLGFFGIHTIRKNEEHLVWVGMAKETAHQLGTPLSSLMGWTELVKESSKDQELNRIVKDMDNDIGRLNKIAQRFSQIGSKSELKHVRIENILSEVIVYFKKRLPQMGKDIKLIEEYQKVGEIPLNPDLFEWAVENIVKNAIDSIESKNGFIKISLFTEDNAVIIDITDSGKGIPKSKRKEIFKPGYSTKKRGWGLGLSLVRRIIEEFHNGKVVIKDSKIDKGTTFRIIFNN